MKRKEKAIRITGILFAAVAAVFVVTAILTRPVIAPSPARVDVPENVPPLPDAAMPRFNQPFPDAAHAAFTATSLLSLVAEIESIAAALGFQPPDRALRDELARSGLSPDAPATLYLNFQPTEDAPVRFLVFGKILDRTALESWLYEEASITPAPPPVSEMYGGFHIETGLPHGAAWADLGAHAAFSNDAPLLRSFIDARSQTPGDSPPAATDGAVFRGVLRAPALVERLATWPLWTAVAGFALDPIWIDHTRIAGMVVHFTLQRHGATWRLQTERAATGADENFGFVPPIPESTLSVAIAGTPPQRAALAAAANTLAAATHDSLTQQSVEALLDAGIGPWYAEAPEDDSHAWTLAFQAAEPDSAMSCIAELTAAPLDVTSNGCSPAGICIAQSGPWVLLSPKARESSAFIDARTPAQPLMSRIRASAPMLQRLTQWGARLGLADPYWNHFLARIQAIHSEVRRVDGIVTTTLDVYFSEPMP